MSRGSLEEMTHLTSERVLIRYKMPLNEVRHCVYGLYARVLIVIILVMCCRLLLTFMIPSKVYQVDMRVLTMNILMMRKRHW